MLDNKSVENIIQYTFNDKKLLNQCFIHSSYANEYNLTDNERLEFLGDSVLSIVVTEKLINMYSEKHSEGELSKVRARIVSTESLVEVCEELKLNSFLKYILPKNNESHTRKLYADLIEAIIGGIYIDGGMENAKKFILRVFDKYIKYETPDIVKSEDYKSSLQEFVQKYKMGDIEYCQLNRSGFDHLPTFEYCVKIKGKEYGRGIGQSKKEAQRLSAKQALEILKNRG